MCQRNRGNIYKKNRNNNKYNVECINLRKFPGLGRVIQHTEEIIHRAQQTTALFELTCRILWINNIAELKTIRNFKKKRQFLVEIFPSY